MTKKSKRRGSLYHSSKLQKVNIWSDQRYSSAQSELSYSLSYPLSLFLFSRSRSSSFFCRNDPSVASLQGPELRVNICLKFLHFFPIPPVNVGFPLGPLVSSNLTNSSQLMGSPLRNTVLCKSSCTDPTLLW